MQTFHLMHLDAQGARPPAWFVFVEVDGGEHPALIPYKTGSSTGYTDARSARLAIGGLAGRVITHDSYTHTKGGE